MSDTVPSVSLRLATPDDLEFVSEVITEVSGGVIEYLTAALGSSLAASEIFSTVFQREIDPYNLNNVILLTVDGQTAGLLFGYESSHQGTPELLENFAGKARVDNIRPLLEAKVANAYWVNTLWTSPAYRGKGIASWLISTARRLARDAELSSVALHCWADNQRARAFYDKEGFKPVGTIAVGGPLRELHPDGGLILNLAA